MRRTIILVIMICGSVMAFSQTDTTPAEQPAAAAEQPAAAAEQPAVEEQPVPDQSKAATEQTQGEAEILAKVEQLTAKLEEANGVIEELRTESLDLKSKAEDADKRAQAAREEADRANEKASLAESKAAANQAIVDDDKAKLKEAEDAAAAAAASAAASSAAYAAEAESLKSRVAELEAKIVDLEANRDALYAKLASFGSLRIDPSAFQELLRSGFSDSQTRLGTWKVSGGILSQTDKNQFFSRITFPLVQSSKPVLYSFETKTGAKGWVGTGIHLFADGMKKPKGYGEGKSLLIWLTRDAKVRGNDGTYLQVYRSDDDVNMERVLDAKVKERLDGWNRIDVLYEPADEFIVLAVNGSVRAAYRTYFGIGAGVSVSLRTLGEGVQFKGFEVRQ
jgi:hypothetical protein